MLQKTTLLLWAALACTLSLHAADNSTFHGDAHHTGQYKGTEPCIKAPAWTFKTNGAVISSAAVSGNSVYFGSDDKNLYALDANTGELKWKFETGGMIRSTPAVSQKTIFFSSYDNFIYALNSQDGSLKWKYETNGEKRFEAKGIHGIKPSSQTMPDFWDLYQSSPLVDNGILYVGSGDDYVYAIDVETGNVIWNFQTGDVVHASPALADGILYIGSWDTYLYALDAKTGQQIWRFKTKDDKPTYNRTGIQSSPTIHNGTVYFGCRDFQFYAVNAKTGVEKWKKEITWVNATPAIYKDSVYFGTSLPSNFFGLNSETGEEILKLNMPFITFSSAAIVNDTAYYGSFDGCLYSVDLKQGEIKNFFASEAALANKDKLFKEDGQPNYSYIFCNDSFDEMYFSAYKLFQAGAIIASPVIENGTLYIGASDGMFYAFK